MREFDNTKEFLPDVLGNALRPVFPEYPARDLMHLLYIKPGSAEQFKRLAKAPGRSRNLPAVRVFPSLETERKNLRILEQKMQFAPSVYDGAFRIPPPLHHMPGAVAIEKVAPFK